MTSTAEKKKISMIPAKPQYDRSVKFAEKRLKVAAYCRVSTELEQQESSYEAQVEYYTNKIEENQNWKNAGIYADDGKIDMILTKSVSRFARNTVDALTTICQLKEKNVAVVFEKEGVNTLDGTGEILLTILSSLAQEESRNISENTRWGVVRRFEKGQVIVNHSKFMGYTKNDKGELVIIPEEAEVVRLIFRFYLEGYSTAKISEYLEEKGIKTATGKDKWNAKKIVWRCSNRLTNGVEQCSDSETLEEGALNRAVMEAIHRITRNEGDFVGAFRQNVVRVIGSYGREQQSDEYSDQIKAKQEEMVALIAENAKVGD